MATAKTPRKATVNSIPKPARRARKGRKFPSRTFQEALGIAEAIQKYAAGQKVRRLTIFEKLDQSPDSTESRRLITASGQYGLTKGSYTAEHLELTPEGKEATGEDVSAAKRLESRFNLAIKSHAPFAFLYEKIKGNKMPDKEVMSDHLSEADVEEDEKAECIDTFILNAKFLGLLRTIAGAERLIPVEQAIEEGPQTPAPSQQSVGAINGTAQPKTGRASASEVSSDTDDFDNICFYITPIGEENSDERQHADFMMSYIIEPAVKEFNLHVVRADKMGKPGMIGKQVVEHILKSRLVIADLSFHNPNVFYELCLRHTTRLPTVQIIRAVEKIPFDLNQYRTIPIETQNAYTLYPKLQTYTAQIANQVRRALEDSESGDNPISLYYPSAKLTWGDK